MDNIKIIENLDISKKFIPDEPEYFEIVWRLNKSPDEKWVSKFEKELKKYLEIENPLFGPYKPKLFFDELVLTCLDDKLIEKQKKYIEEKFIEVINSFQS